MRDRCRQAGTTYFLKQLGSIPTESGQPYLVSGKGEDPAKWPPDLRVREFPINKEFDSNIDDTKVFMGPDAERRSTGNA
jgi:hypothetical protein